MTYLHTWLWLGWCVYTYMSRFLVPNHNKMWNQGYHIEDYSIWMKDHSLQESSWCCLMGGGGGGGGGEVMWPPKSGVSEVGVFRAPQPNVYSYYSWLSVFIPYAELSSYLGYLREPHPFSMGGIGISRVTVTSMPMYAKIIKHYIEKSILNRSQCNTGFTMQIIHHHRY